MKTGLASRAKKLAMEIVALIEVLDEEDGDGEAVAFDGTGTLRRLRDELAEAVAPVEPEEAE